MLCKFTFLTAKKRKSSVYASVVYTLDMGAKSENFFRRVNQRFQLVLKQKVNNDDVVGLRREK